MLIPINSDAPLYHWPVMTASLIVSTCAFSWHGWNLEPESFEQMKLVFGQGMHPEQWVTAAFLHEDVTHLIGNMFFLLPFGLLVEGKVGWWRFLLLYAGLGVLENVLVQALMLNYQLSLEQIAARVLLGLSPEMSTCGSSGMLFGLAAIAALWAPKNDMTCLMMLTMRARVVEIPMTLLVGLYVCWEGFLFVLDDFSLGLAGQQLLGGLLGGIAGYLFLRFKWVDCEGWDLISVMTGNDTAARKTREMVLGPTSQQALAEAEQTAEQRRAAQRQAAVIQIQEFLQSGNVVAADAYYGKVSATLGELPLSAAQYLQLGKALLDARKFAECIPHFLEYLKRQAEPAVKVRLKVAQLLLEQNGRPATALEVLQGIPTAPPLPEELERVRQKLLQTAHEQMENADLELE